MADLRRLRRAKLNRKTQGSDQDQGGRSNESHRSQSPGPSATTSSNNSNTYSYYYRGAGERKKRKSDETLADWTVAVAVFTGFLALASIIGDAFSFWALRTINGQLEEMRKQSDIAYVDERPWIGAPIITIAQGAKGELTFLFKFKNVGKTPTTGLFITAAFSTENNWKIDVHHQCEWAKNYVSDGGKKDFELYSIVPQGTGLVSGERIASVQESNAPTFTDFTGKDYQDIRKGGTIVGCVIYNAFSDPPPYKETGFVGWVKSIGGHLEVPNISVIDPK